MSVEQVIELLADGHIHSGEELGKLLGVSRTAVWKQLNKIEELGLEVEAVKGKGYQLLGGIELLSREEIFNSLPKEAQELVVELDVLGSVDSTNTLVLDKAKSVGSHGYFCLAEHQAAGRGRHGRRWVSPYGRNIYFSCGWAFSGGAAALEGLSLAVGVAIVRALSSCSINGVQLKWPNDVLWKGKKLAGVLLEMTGDASGECQVVVGVGLNVGMVESEAKAIDQDWVSLASIKPDVSRNELVSGLIRELSSMLEGYQQQGFSSLRSEWESLDSFRDKEVDIRVGDQVTRGVVRGVSDNGALRLDTSSGEQLVYGGEASLRSA
ncbi:MAG: bifunctional biotin--[acetyl-CoA-carboxylase] ligase/biotin operon repressor BirA [Cellvibrionaceae bacterium]